MKLIGKTDVGKKRKNNQDSFVLKHYPENSAAVALVCDGMGGASGGNIASTLACEAFTERMDGFFSAAGAGRLPSVPTEGDIASAIAHAVYEANRRVFERAENDSTLQGMGTTLVAAVIIGERLYAVNVGDSRLYMFAHGQLRQITKDHSLVQFLLDSGKITGDEAENHPNRNVITRAIGPERSIEADIFSVELKHAAEDDTFCALLCSDGLSGYVKKEHIGDILAEQLPEHPEKAADALIAAANDAGGADNITAVLVCFGTEDGMDEGAAHGTV